MRSYELIFIVRPDASEELLKETVEKTEEMIKSSRCEIEKTENWGKRRLAYEVKKFGEGIYVKINFLAPSEMEDMGKKVYDYFKFSEEVLRHMIVQEKKPEEKAEKT